MRAKRIKTERRARRAKMCIAVTSAPWRRHRGVGTVSSADHDA